MFKFLKRFFEPAILDKNEALKSFFGTMINAFYFDILPILCIPILISYLQQNNLLGIYKLSIFFTVAICISFAVRVSMRGWYWYSHRRFWSVLEDKYRPIILTKNNSYFEKTGTGKIQSIVDNGLQTWARVTNDSIWYISRIVVTVSLGVYVILQINYELLFLYFFLLIFASIVLVYFRIKKFELDLIQKDIRNEFNANSVRSIMSRTEILFSNKIKDETKKLYDLKTREFEIGKKTDKYGAFSVVPSEVLFLILPFGGTSLYLHFYNVNPSPATIAVLVSFIYFSSKMSNMIWQFVSFVYVILDNFPDIKKLWDFIDNVPQIKNYETGKKFVHKGGTIEFKNVNFGYESDIIGK